MDTLRRTQVRQRESPAFSSSEASLVPGAVELAIIDCFALEVPLMMTKFPYHGPEVGYLKNRENGLMTEEFGELRGLCERCAC